MFGEGGVQSYYITLFAKINDDLTCSVAWISPMSRWVSDLGKSMFTQTCVKTCVKSCVETCVETCIQDLSLCTHIQTRMKTEWK